MIDLLSKIDIIHFISSFKAQKVIGFIEKKYFVGFVEEIPAYLKKFPQPRVSWLKLFSMSETKNKVTLTSS